MKAAYINDFGGRDKINYTEDFPKPVVGEGEVLVRIKAAGVNPVDYKIREGYRRNLTINFPAILGWDMAGVVEDRGFGARRFNIGDEVFAYARRLVVEKGTYAEYISIPECYLAAKPKSISFEDAASVPLVGLTAYQSLHEKGKIKAGQIVLILGASGGVGSMAVQLSKVVGARVVALASEVNRDYLLSIGADQFVNYKDEDWVSKFFKLYSEKADFVFDCIGKETLPKGFECVKAGGTLVSITNQPNEEMITKYKITNLYHFVEPNVLHLGHLASLIDDGKIKTHVNKILPLHKVAQAHELIESEHTRGKIVLSI